MIRKEYRTTTRRALLALGAGALTGALLIMAPDALYVFSQEPERLGINLDFLRAEFLIALIIWAVGLAVIGAPVWWLLHRRGLRHWIVAVLVGGIGGSLGAFALFLSAQLPIEGGSFADSGGYTMIDGKLTAYGWLSMIQSALTVGALGIVVSAVIWRIAYRRAGTD